MEIKRIYNTFIWKQKTHKITFVLPEMSKYLQESTNKSLEKYKYYNNPLSLNNFSKPYIYNNNGTHTNTR